jgi:hypothetical protein
LEKGWMTRYGWNLRVALMTVTATYATTFAPPTCAAETWTDQCTVGPLQIRADFHLGGLAPLFGELAGLQTDLVQTLGIDAARGPIEVYLFETKRAYRAYLDRNLPGLPERRALFVQRGGRRMVFGYKQRELDVDLRHETTHALLHCALPMVPLWLDEGLAEYFEVPRERRSGKNSHLAAVQRKIGMGKLPDLAALEKIGDLKDMGKSDYEDAWAWVHFMLHGPAEARGELLATLDAIKKNTPPGRLSERLQGKFGDAPSWLKQHFTTWNSRDSR